MIPAGEPVDVAGVGQQPRCAGGADAVQLQQRGSAGFDEGGDLFLAGLDLAVDAFQLGDQLGGEPAPGLADDVAGPGGGQQRAGLGRGQELPGASGDQLEQQPVDPVEGLGPGPAELVAPVGPSTGRHLNMTSGHTSYEQLASQRRESDEYRQGHAEAQRAYLLGKAVRDRRLALGLSQVELAARAA